MSEIITDFAASYSVVETQDNNYIGYCWSGSPVDKTRLYHFDDLGSILWNKQLPFWPAEGDRCFRELTNEGFICCGSGNYGNHITLIKTDSTGNIVSVDEEITILNPQYLQCYPNPFNPGIKFEIVFSIQQNEQIQIDIFNVKGQKVESIPLSFDSAQNDSVEWNAENQASGLYFVQLKGNNRILETKKITLIK